MKKPSEAGAGSLIVFMASVWSTSFGSGERRSGDTPETPPEATPLDPASQIPPLVRAARMFGTIPNSPFEASLDTSTQA